jgi:uracil-DNA glycosylase family 4
MCDSHACPLRDVRTKLVFGAGNANADLMFVGEAPGATEDQTGLPFVGRAGKLLDDLLLEIGIQRSDVFITNVICCRPPGNRDPLPEEIDACKPYLFRKIELIEPKVICTLGNFATKLLTGSPTRARGGGSRAEPVPAVPSGRRAAHRRRQAALARGHPQAAGAAGRPRRAGGGRVR